MKRPVFLIGGAPKIQLDAVRYMSVHATGKTVLNLARLFGSDLVYQILLSNGAESDGLDVQRYETREDLEARIDQYLKLETNAIIVLSAAVNDYELDSVLADGALQQRSNDQSMPKIPSGASSVEIKLRPAGKLISTLKARGHKGPIIACKYEDKQTVIDSAQRLLKREGLNYVLANSLCGSIQSIVSADAVKTYASRPELLEDLAQIIKALASAD